MVGMQDLGKSPAGKTSLWTWVGGAVAGVAVGAGIWFVATDRSNQTPPGSETGTETAADPADPAPTETPAEAPAETPAAIDIIAPSIDTVRAEADGSVLIAGAAAPAAKVQVLVDGAVAGTGEADAQGKFATFLNLGASAKPRVLTLMAEGSDGKDLTSATNVILAPTPELTPEPEPVPAEGVADTATSAEPEATEAAAATATPDVLVADAEGVTKQTPDTPLADILIDTIGYDALGNVDIAGRGAAGSLVWLYIDNALSGTAPMSDTGKWRIKLSGISTGVHTLRVDQLGEDGKVTSRAETPFQREAVEKVAKAPAAPLEAVEPAAPASETAEPAQTAEPAAPPQVKEVTITVQPGFTLWAIARENYGDGMLFVRVYQANKDQIRNPDLIYPGQVFTVPSDPSGG